MQTIIYITRDLDGNDEPHQAKYYLWQTRPNKCRHNSMIMWVAHLGMKPIGNTILSEADRLDLGIPECEPGACMKLIITVKQWMPKQKKEKVIEVVKGKGKKKNG